MYGKREIIFQYPEKIPILIHTNARILALKITDIIDKLIREKHKINQPCVLCLPTGSTPITIYQELVRRHHEENLDFSNVVSFNLDEYYPIKSDSIHSYNRFMKENLFNHVNIHPSNVHIPSGEVSLDGLQEYCIEYEKKILQAGGIDLCLLGIGLTGHIGFNEPGSDVDTRTRLVTLDTITRKEAASDFFGEKNVPLQALTMGIETILSSRFIIIMATGEKKGRIVRHAIEEPPSKEVPATFLQLHSNAVFHLDSVSAEHLTRKKTPWLIKPIVTWDTHMAIKAVLWLCRKVQKPIFKLNIDDFHLNGLHNLVYYYNGVDDLCVRVFREINDKIYSYPKSNLFSNRRVLIFSPHPDDDVICMGGMIQFLFENHNNIKVAYCTNGSVSVFDRDLEQNLNWMQKSFSFFTDKKLEEQIVSNIRKYKNELHNKKAGDPDTPSIQRMKGNIRASEAINALQTLGLDIQNTVFLDMPFYQTGIVQKNPISEADITLAYNLLLEFKPNHIFVAGDWSDPHGTHRMSYNAVKLALSRYLSHVSSNSDLVYQSKIEQENAMRGNGSFKCGSPNIGTIINPQIWLYRGSWIEYEPENTDVFLPLSVDRINRKIMAIYKHKSQKDRARFPGIDPREFSERARERNLNSATLLDSFGFAQYLGMECFKLSSIKQLDKFD